VKLPGVDPVTVILQKNTMKIDPENKMIFEFDLKGSSFQRHTIPQELLSGKKRRFQNDSSINSTSKFLSGLPPSLQDFITSNILTLKDHDLVDLMDFNLTINIS
jgi:hypothetical protein